MAPYFSRSDLLAAISQDSQAKLSTDPSRVWPVGTGDGLKTTFDTPFLEATTLKAFVDGEEVTSPAPTLSRGTGTGGRDQVVFGTAPAEGAVVAVSADAKAINADVLDAVATAVSSDMDGYLHAYLPISDAALRATLKYKGILLAKMRLRGRRNVDVVDAFELEWKAAVRWFEDVAKGAIVLNLSEKDPELEAEDLFGSEPPVFGPPNDPQGSW
jgi:phage gp36-like protein